MPPGGNTLLLVFAILSGLVSIPLVRLVALNDTLDRKLAKHVTDIIKRDEGNEDILLVLDRQPGNAVAGKLFGVQPCVRLLVAKARSPNESVEVSSKFSHRCQIEGETKSKLRENTSFKFTNLKINKPAIGCILVFELIDNGTSSRIESLPFDVLSADLVLTIGLVQVHYKNKTKNYNLNFTFNLTNANQISNLPWQYTVSSHLPLTNPETYVKCVFHSINFSQVPVTVTQCFLSDWGYRNRLTVKIESNSSGWSIENYSKPFDAFTFESLRVRKEKTFTVRAILKGKGSFPSAEEEREQICASAINQLGHNYPQLKWTNLTVLNIGGKDEFVLVWTVQGYVKQVLQLYKDIPAKKIIWNNNKWTVQRPINITDKSGNHLAPMIKERKQKTISFSWKTIGPFLVVVALLIPVGILFCVWPRREREIQKKYQERLSHYVLKSDGKHDEMRGEDNVAFQTDRNISSSNNTRSNGIPNGSSIRMRADLVQLKAASLIEKNNVPDSSQPQTLSDDEGPQRIHILRSRPPSKPTIVSPATAQYASVEVPSPDDSIENLARDILATPITVTETSKGLNGPIVTSFVKFRSSSEPMGSRISVSAIANPISSSGSDRHSAGTTLPEPQ